MKSQKQRPMLFSTMMVQALLQGRKKMTRRIIKNHTAQNWSAEESDGIYHEFKEWYNEDDGKLEPAEWLLLNVDGDVEDVIGKCPYGEPGDIIWVRETFLDSAYPCSDYNEDPDNNERFAFKADCPADQIKNVVWKPSIFMPKEAARIWLKVKSIKIERIHDISVEDCIAEGIVSIQREHDACMDVKDQFETLWRLINGDESWFSNPYVWVVEFEVLSTAGKPESLN